MILAYALLWLVLAVVAIANGMVRERSYGQHISELRAHQISTLTGMILTGAVVLLFSLAFPIGDAHSALRIGLLWVVMTVLFELGFGHWVAGHPWARLFADYDLLAGRLWLLFLVWLGVLPYLVYRFGPGG